MKRIVGLSLIIVGFFVTGITSYRYYLQTPAYALRQISDAAERQDQVTLAKYVYSDSIVAGLMAPLQTLAEAKEKEEWGSIEEAKVQLRNSTGSDDQLEKLKESELDLSFQATKMPIDAALLALKMDTISKVRSVFEHFDSTQILNIKVTGTIARVMIKDRDGFIFPITMVWEHKTWHVMQLELPDNTKKVAALPH